MTVRVLFKKAWELSTLAKYKRLLWYGFIPSIFTTVLTTLAYSFRGYQYWQEKFQHQNIAGYLLELMGEFFRFIATNPGIGILTFLGGTILVLTYMLLPIIFQGGLMKLIADIQDGKEVRYRSGIIYGAHHFFKLFEFKSLFSPFRLTWISLALWVIGTFDPQNYTTFLVPIILWGLVAVAANLLFIFCEYFIVLHEIKIIPAIRKSSRLVFMNIEQVIHIVVLMFVIGLRVIFNLVLTFAIPLGILIIGTYFAQSYIASYTFALSIIVGTLLIIFVSYINGIIAVFTTAAWTILFRSYTEGLEIKEDDDTLIEELQKEENAEEQDE